ncbi:endonuclease-reverse transcriptase [Plakobranchus ocellatus]|uniref:Endonuclease-reverse transcriptase n=1 Tax=Plakobranchus ocellatus TaxID=259542 RepID=A0AAV4DK88_9GAST|nr:endonuclease-reverse transcriptase [Plakobranchus ocellatus]
MRRKMKRDRTAQGHMKQLKARSRNLEVKLQYDTPQSNPTESCGVGKGKEQAEKYIATYNTRTIRQQDDLEGLLEELEQIKWHIIGLSETKRRGEGLSELPGGHWIFEKGKTKDNPTAKGVALLINRNMTKYVEIYMTMRM